MKNSFCIFSICLWIFASNAAANYGYSDMNFQVKIERIPVGYVLHVVEENSGITFTDLLSCPQDQCIKEAINKFINNLSSTKIDPNKIEKWFTDDKLHRMLDEQIYNPALFSELELILGENILPAFPLYEEISSSVEGNIQPRAFGKIYYKQNVDYFAKIYWFPAASNQSGLFKKPIVASDAFDPYNERSAMDIYKDESTKKLLSTDSKSPRGYGYDMFFLDFSQGGGDILINAGIETKFLEWLQTKTNERIILTGPSMSGLVGRVSLLFCMPQNNALGKNLAKNIKGYFSVDTPHQGASIPFQMQSTVGVRLFWDDGQVM